ncbi:MAG: plasmid pRiA4b ORF-3 family protein [Bacteroidota bacterium]
MDERLMPLISDLLNAIGKTAAAHPDLKEHYLTTACELYRDYFSRPRQNPDEDPPFADDPILDDLLANLWQVIVDRETAELDESLLGGDLPGVDGPVTTLNELYHLIFTGLLARPTPETDTWEPTAVMNLTPKNIQRVAEEVGVTFSPRANRKEYPAAVSLLLDAASQAFDPAVYARCQELLEQHPELPLLHFTLVSQLLAADRFEEAFAAALRGAELHPDDLKLVTLFVSLQQSPEATLGEAHRLGDPPDLRRFHANPDGSYPLAEYCLFENVCLSIDIAAERDLAMLPRMERLLLLSFPERAVLEKIPFHFDRLANQNISRGRVFPDTWTPPASSPDTPLANALLTDAWEDYKVEFLEEAMDTVAPAASGAAVRQLPRQKGQRRADDGQIYQLKVSLEGISPPIWRRLLIPASTELAEVHEILQTAFDWLGYHLHQFIVGRDYFAPPSPYEDFAQDYRGLTLADCLFAPKDKIVYEYDFGDSWRHRIVLEKVLEREYGQSYPYCLKGKRHRPPEDVGGPWGYEHFLQVIRDPKHEEYEDMVEWSGGYFDPEAFDLGEVNRRLGGR